MGHVHYTSAPQGADHPGRVSPGFPPSMTELPSKDGRPLPNPGRTLRVVLGLSLTAPPTGAAEPKQFTHLATVHDQPLEALQPLTPYLWWSAQLEHHAPRWCRRRHEGSRDPSAVRAARRPRATATPVRPDGRRQGRTFADRPYRTSQRPNAPPRMRISSPRTTSTTGSRRWPHRDSALATIGRVANERPSAHQTPTMTRNTAQ